MIRRLTATILTAVALCAAAQAQQVVTIGAGVYSGSESQPVPSISGEVLRLIDPGPPIKSEATGKKARLVNVYYEGEVVQAGLAKPTGGNVGELYIGDKQVKLTSGDIAEGYLHTEDFGDVLLFFLPSLSTEKCFLVMTRQQLGEATPVQPQPGAQKPTEQPQRPVSKNMGRIVGVLLVAGVVLVAALVAMLCRRRRAGTS